MTRRILLTGAQGFVGRNTAAIFLQADPEIEILGVGRSDRLNSTFTHSVRCNSRSIPAPLPEELERIADNERYHYASCDVSDQTVVGELLRTFAPHAIVHMCGSLRDDPLKNLVGSNVLALESLYEAIQAANIPAPTVIVGSSGAVYGRPSPSDLPLTEETPPKPFDLYSTTKRTGEDVAQILGARYEIPTIIARIFNVAGPAQDERHICGHMASQLVAQRSSDRPVLRLGALEPTRDFIDVRDVASALYCLVNNGTPGTTYNVASGIETSMQAILDLIIEIAGVKSFTIDQLPARNEDNQRCVADIRRLSATGFQPAFDLRETLTDIYQYYIDISKNEDSAHPHILPFRRPRTNESTTLEVSNEMKCSYNISVEPNLLRRLPAILKSQYPSTRMTVLTDTTVDRLYGTELIHQMKQLSLNVKKIVVPEGDESKAFETYHHIIDRLYHGKFDRRGLLVNLGGGMVTDVGGFVAASYLRGVRYVNVPTTLLAQHDAAIGGKVAVNMPWAKNFVGAFHHPDAVYSDPLILKTLPKRHLAAGIAETIKIAIIDDVDLFVLLEKNVSDIMQRTNSTILQQVVLKASASKIKLLAPAPFEIDLRRVLNFGHPLETEFAYSGILHGEAVAWGMCISTAIAEARGICDSQTAERIYRLIAAYGMPPSVPQPVLHAVVKHLESVRLVRANQLNFVMPERLGKIQIVAEVDDREFHEAIDRVSSLSFLSKNLQKAA